MATVIDIDSHFEPGDDWLKPYPKLAARLPKLNPALLAVDTICGDLLHNVPEEARPPLESLYPPGLAILFGQEKADEAERRAEFEGKNQFEVANAQARLKWIDAQGIDIQNVICLSGIANTVAQLMVQRSANVRRSTFTPALLISMSSGPSSWVAQATRLSTLCKSPTSAAR